MYMYIYIYICICIEREMNMNVYNISISIYTYTYIYIYINSDSNSQTNSKSNGNNDNTSNTSTSNDDDNNNNNDNSSDGLRSVLRDHFHRSTRLSNLTYFTSADFDGIMFTFLLHLCFSCLKPFYDSFRDSSRHFWFKKTCVFVSSNWGPSAVYFKPRLSLSAS